MPFSASRVPPRHSVWLDGRPVSTAELRTELAANSENTPMDGMAGADASTQLFAAGFVFVLAAASPFLGLPENLIGLAIIGFALYQAWSMNRRAKLEIEGPLEIRAS